MISEVALFLGALLGCILTFSSAMSVLKQEDPDFAGIPKGAYALIRMVLGAYDSSRYAKLHNETALEVMTIVFCIITIIFLVSMLIAQLSCAYSAVYEDMVGYARLERMQTIVEIVASVPKRRWTAFVESLRLGKRLEFNAGDIGVSGGIQVKEAANLHPTTVDNIKRYGGSTNPEAQWPDHLDDTAGMDEDRCDKIEKLLQKVFKRLTRSGGHSGSRSGTRTGTGTGTGTGSGSLDSSNDNHED